MKIKNCICAAAVFCVALPAYAHDFWLVTTDFTVAPETDVTFDFVVGHGAERGPWSLKWDRIVSLTDYAPSGPNDLQASITAMTDAEKGSASVTLSDPGTHMIAFTSRAAWIELEAEKFNGYVDLEGLTLASEKRTADGTLDQPGIEVYGRRSKALIQVGDEATANVMEPIGQTLEIVPLANPYALEEGASLPVQVLYRGMPLEGATIDLESLSTDLAPMVTQMTDTDGKASFDIAQTGAWKLNVIWTVPVEGRKDGAVFDTVFSSLTFGY